MVVCPVCEHAQAGGSECEICGRRLQSPPELEAVPAAPVLDGLESTSHGATADAVAEPLPGLEQTSQERVPAPVAQLIPDLERTGTAPVDPPIAAIPDVERIGDDLPTEERTPYPAVVLCRYCRTEAAPGDKLCSRCGMRLPTVALAPAAPVADAVLLMCSCGTPIRGPRCPACGARTPTP